MTTALWCGIGILWAVASALLVTIICMNSSRLSRIEGKYYPEVRTDD